MPKSDYNYSLSTTEDKNKIIIAIVDLDLGGMSVTNNIENVVADICKKEKLETKDALVIYKDSEGKWDGWDTVNETFIHFRRRSVSEALDQIKKYYYHTH